jgi:hypothetical protein
MGRGFEGIGTGLIEIIFRNLLGRSEEKHEKKNS